MTCQDSFHEVAFNISFWTRNISSARILFWRGVFSEEAKCIKNQKTKLSKQSNLLFLHSFIDENDFLRVGEQLQNFQLSFNQKHPIILPSKHE